MNNNSNNCGDCGTTCSECGRPWAICKQDGGCGCNKCKDIKFCEYGRMANGCIREKQPGCPMQAVIPSVTVESIEGIKNLADCLVHVSDINTTFYIDDKHRPIITWAGPIDIPGYDMEGNPNNYRDQIVTDVANQEAVIYDKSGRGYVFGLVENIDLQDQVDNKLDEMAEDGTLADIISEYLNSIAIFGFDTVASMKNADNLINGSYARTMGYYAKNDGGGALYKIRNITNDDVIDEGSIIEMNDDQNQLVAELISEETVTPEMFGAYGDGTHDDTSSLQNSLNYGKKVYAKGTYIVSSTINVKDSIDMDGNSYIKADNSLTTKVVLIAPNYKVGCIYNINVDASGVAGIGIAVGSPRKAILNLNVINAGTTGIDCNNLSSTGNNENEFKCNVIGNSSGTTVTGVLCNCFDSIFSSITTQDCQRGVEVNNGELIATSVHSWLSDATASSLWSNSCAVYNPSYYNTEIEWLYQDSVKYGYLCNGAYGHIGFLEYNNTLTNHSTLYNDYINVKTTGGAVRMTIDNYKNAIDENSYLKYDISQSTSSEFGVTNKNGVASILSAVQSKLPFSDANDAPQWGTFSCPYTITNMGSSTNGVLKCEVVGYYAVQKFYRDDFTDVPREYIRMRKLGTSTWSGWKYYSPAA